MSNSRNNKYDAFLVAAADYMNLPKKNFEKDSNNTTSSVDSVEPNIEMIQNLLPHADETTDDTNFTVVVPPAKSKKKIIQLDDDQTPSVFIPFCFANVTKDRIAGAFERLGWGEIDRIDEIAIKIIPGKKRIKKVFVHFKKWNDCEEAQHWRQKYLNGEEIKIVYDGEWYWKTKASTAPKPDFNNQKN
tara:strand:- start:16 stop:579 length:564 start_codon:yes stop_codon:yes gene_type:complete